MQKTLTNVITIGELWEFLIFFFTCVIYIVQDKSNDCVPNSNNEREDLGKI